MKFFTIIILLVTTTSFQAQNKPARGPHHFGKRFEDLEKIKLMEVLNLDEETTLKFFKRRNSSRMKVDKIMKEHDELLNKMKELINSGNTDKNFDSFINQSLEYNTKINAEKNNFIKFLDDILTKEQIAKVIIFEKSFRNEIRDLLIEKGRNKYFRNRIEDQKPDQN